MHTNNKCAILTVRCALELVTELPKSSPACLVVESLSFPVTRASETYETVHLTANLCSAACNFLAEHDTRTIQMTRQEAQLGQLLRGFQSATVVQDYADVESYVFAFFVDYVT